MHTQDYTTTFVARVTLEGSMFFNRTCTVQAVVTLEGIDYAECAFTGADLPAWAHRVRIEMRHLHVVRALPPAPFLPIHQPRPANAVNMERKS